MADAVWVKRRKNRHGVERESVKVLGKMRSGYVIVQRRQRAGQAVIPVHPKNIEA